jgi:hypothetical protein
MDMSFLRQMLESPTWGYSEQPIAAGPLPGGSSVPRLPDSSIGDGGGGGVPAINPIGAAREDLLRMFGQPGEVPQAMDPVRPAFRTQDAIVAGIGLLAPLLFGNKGGQFSEGLVRRHLDSKMQKAELDTRQRQTRENQRVQQANMNRQGALDQARMRLGFMEQDQNRADQLAQIARGEARADSKEAAALRRENMNLARQYSNQAYDENTEASYRASAARQAIALLEGLEGDTTAAQMVANLQSILPKLEEESAANKNKRLQNQRLEKVIANLDEQFKDRHNTALANIAARRAMVQLAIATGDVNWFKAYAGYYDEAIGAVDEQLKAWAKASQTMPNGISDEDMKNKVQPLIDYRDRLRAEKGAIPMPGQPSSTVQFTPEGTPIQNPGSTAPFQLQGPIGGGGSPGAGRGLPVPDGGVDMSGFLTESGKKEKDAAVTKQKQDADTQKQWEDARKKVLELRAEMASIDPSNKKDLDSAKREMQVWVSRMETLKPGSTGTRAETGQTPAEVVGGALSKIRAAAASAKGASPSTGRSATAKSGTSLLQRPKAKTGVDVAKERRLAKQAIEAGVDPEAVKREFKRKTGQDY